jgi:hypothetical protein
MHPYVIDKLATSHRQDLHDVAERAGKKRTTTARGSLAVPPCRHWPAQWWRLPSSFVKTRMSSSDASMLRRALTSTRHS